MSIHENLALTWPISTSLVGIFDYYEKMIRLLLARSTDERTNRKKWTHTVNDTPRIN